MVAAGLVGALALGGCEDKGSGGGGTSSAAATTSAPVSASTSAAATSASASDTAAPSASASDTAVPSASASASAAPSTTATTKSSGTGTAAATASAADTTTAVASASASAAPAGACGATGQPKCPLQAWMGNNVSAPMKAGDAAKLAAGLRAAAKLAPPGYGDWAKYANDGAAAVEKSKDVADGKPSCKTCHNAYQKKYRAEMRDRPLP